jgi:hypothetical protein
MVGSGIGDLSNKEVIKCFVVSWSKLSRTSVLLLCAREDSREKKEGETASCSKGTLMPLWIPPLSLRISCDCRDSKVANTLVATETLKLFRLCSSSIVGTIKV